MRKLFICLIFLGNITGKLNAQQCLSGGCSNFVNQFPPATFTPTTSWSTVSSFMNGGNWTLFNVICGNTYDFTYCELYGGVSTSWDAQLTLYNNSGLSLLCFSDDNCGTPALAPYIRWTATFTGVVRLLTSAYSSGGCKSNGPSGPYNRLMYRVSNMPTSLVTVTVNNVIGGTRSNARVRLYNSDYSQILQTVFTNSSGQAPFSPLNNGSYNIEVYYTPTGVNPPIGNYEEFWGSQAFSICSGGQSIPINFIRNQPYIYSPPTFSPNTLSIGQSTTGTFVVRNALPYATNSYVEIWVDRNQASPWDYNNSSSIRSIGSGATSSSFFNISPANTDQYKFYAFVYSFVNSGYILTDQYAWTDAFTTNCPTWPTPTSPSPGGPAGSGSILQTTTPTFSWNGTSTGIYHIQIWDSATNPTTDNNVIYGFETPVTSPGHCISGLSHTILPSDALLNNGKYKWSVHRNDPCSECPSNPTTQLYFKIDIPPTCTTPTVQAKTITFIGNDGISITANWQVGSGTRHLVKVNTANIFSDPINGIEPSNIDNSYHGSGEQVVHFNSNSSVYVNQLTPGVTYYFRVYEANCTGNQVIYNTTQDFQNPNLVTMQVNGGPPIANFAAPNGMIVAGQSVQFQDLSVNATSWNWQFYRTGATGNFSLETTRNSQNPQVTFNNAGCYRVTLTATNSFGSDDETKDCYIYVKPNPSASIPATAAMSIQHNSYFGGDPVNTAQGIFTFQQHDLFSKGINTTVSIDRLYSSKPTYLSQFGLGWYFQYGMRISTGEYSVSFWKGDGSITDFALYPNGEARCLVPVFYDSLYYTNSGGLLSYTYIEKDGTKWNFDNSGLLTSRVDLNGNTTQIVRTGNLIQKIVLPGGREIVFTYNNFDRISTISNGLITAYYFYNASGLLMDSSRIVNSTTIYKYNAANELEEIISPNGGRIIKNEYTGSKVTKQWDAYNALTNFEYDSPSPGHTTITNAIGKSKIVQHDESYKIVSQRDEMNYEKKYRYTQDHRLDTITDQRGNKYKFYIDDKGNRYKTRDPLNNSDSLAFTQFGKPFYMRDKEGNIRNITYTSTLNPSVIELSNGAQYRFFYDQYGQDTISYDPLNHKLSKKYTSQGDLVLICKKYSTDSLVYDAIGRPIVHINGRGFKDSVYYNHYGQPTRIVDQLGFFESIEYDLNGNMIKHTDKEGISTLFYYDLKDRLIRVVKAGITIKEYVWDALDRLIRVRDGNKNCLIYSNDDLGRVIAVADSVLGIIAEYGYDALGNKVAYVNSYGNIWSSRFDALNRLVGIKNPLNDSTKIKYNKNSLPVEYVDETGKSVRLFYDGEGVHYKTIDKNNNYIQLYNNLLGQPDSIRDARGFFRTMTYDEDSRLRTYNDGFGNHQYLYDSTNNIIEFRDLEANIIKSEYNARNEKTTEKWNGNTLKQFGFNKNGVLTSGWIGGSIQYRFVDEFGRIIKDSSTWGHAVYYERDSVGNVKKVRLSDGKQISYNYNSLNSCISVNDWNNQNILLTKDKEGEIVSISYPNDRKTEIVRNSAYQITSWQNRVSSVLSVFQKNNPVYNKRGEIVTDTSGINYFPQASSSKFTNPYATYGAADRKIKYEGDTYVYNLNGGLTNVNGPDIANWYQYSADGMLSGTFNFGLMNQSARDALMGRIQKANFVTQTRYTLGYEFAEYPVALQEFNLSNTILATNIFTPDGILLARDSAGSIKYYHHNAYGNTIALSNSSGDITDTYAYTLFGNNFTHTGTSTQPYTWQGMYGVQRDAKDLYYMGHRFYDANTGTFLSKDPIQSSLSETRSLNPYLFGLNDPLSFNDPTGTYPQNTNTISLNWFERFAVSNAGNITIQILKGLVVAGKISSAILTLNPLTSQFGATLGIGYSLTEGNYEQAGLGITIATQLPNFNLGNYYSGTSRFSSFITPKISNQMSSRGWTEELIHNAVDNPFAIRSAINKATGNAATAYFEQNGSYVVRDNITKQIIQISNKFNANWVPDETIINPYIPR